MSRMPLTGPWIGGLAAVGLLLLLACCGGFTAPLEGIFLLAFGWGLFLWRVVPEIEFSGDSAAVGVIALLLFAVGLHAFVSWLHRAVRTRGGDAAIDDAASTTPPAWKIRWSAQCVVLILVLFVAGISTVGITHQIVWLLRDPQPLLASGGMQAAHRMQSGNNLKQFGVAAHVYHDDARALPPGYAADQHGLPLHGWMTLLLPQFEHQRLYDTIDHSRAWDDPANQKSFQTQLGFAVSPDRRLPAADDRGYALTHYAGSVDFFGTSRAWKFAEITDGTGQTILFGEAAGNYKPWGHPRNVRDVRLGINQNPDGFGGPWSGGGGQFVFADGSVHYIHPAVDPNVLEALATPNAEDEVGEY